MKKFAACAASCTCLGSPQRCVSRRLGLLSDSRQLYTRIERATSAKAQQLQDIEVSGISFNAAKLLAIFADNPLTSQLQEGVVPMAGKISGLAADIKIADLERALPNVVVTDRGIPGVLDKDDCVEIKSTQGWKPIAPETAVALYLAEKRRATDWKAIADVLREFERTVPRVADDALQDWDESKAIECSLREFAKKLETLYPSMSRYISTRVENIYMRGDPWQRTQELQRFSDSVRAYLYEILQGRS